jgi:putative inorganic carbon (HCO3(-)) transporter
MVARIQSDELAPGLLTVLLAIPIGLLAGLEPALAIGGALAIAFVLFALADLSAGLTVFVFLTFMAQIPNVAGPAVSLVKLAGLWLAISWIAVLAVGQGSNRSFFTAHPGLSYALALFLALNGLSFLWAESGGEVIAAVLRYALNISLFLIIFTAVQSKKHLHWVLIAFVVGATVSGLYGIVNPPSNAIDPSRLSGTIGNANELATALVAGVALSGGLAITARTPLGRVLSLFAAGACLFSLFLTASRGGLVGLSFMLIAMIFIGGRHRAGLGLAALLVGMLAIGYFTTLAPPSAKQRITEQNGGTGRVDLWTVGKRMVNAKPLTGVGAGNFSTASVHYLLEPGALERSDLIVDDPQPTHNTYLEVFAEIGVPGGLLFLFLIGSCLAFGLRAKRLFAAQGDRTMQILTAAVIVALVGTLASDVFVSDEYSKQLWLLLGLCPALLMIATIGRGKTEPRESPDDQSGFLLSPASSS